MNVIKSILVFAALSVIAMSCSKKELPGESHYQTKENYYCPMHPQVTSDKPGVCPICSMELVKKAEEKKTEMKEMPGMLELSAQKQILANVTTVKIKKEPFTKDFISYSYLDFAEQNRKLISARFSGRIEKLFVNKTGDYVTVGQPLFEVYSPDLVQAQNEYLIAVSNMESIRSTSMSDTVVRKNSLITSSRKRLELYGLTAEQISKLESSREVQYTLTYYSTINGTVINKKIQEGMYVNEGTLLYDIADMSTLWSIAEIYENDLPTVAVGAKVQLRLPAYPEKAFDGKVNFIYPVIDLQTRTIKVRSELSNADGLLRPQMYGEIVFRQDLGKQLLIPQDAVLFTGKRQITWVKTSEKHFESREITLGAKNDGKYQVLDGLNEDEEVAVTGGFLIDSESQLRNGESAEHHPDDMKNNNAMTGKEKEL